MKCKCKLTSTTPWVQIYFQIKESLEFVEGIYYDYDVIEEHGLVYYVVNISSSAVSMSKDKFYTRFDDITKIREDKIYYSKLIKEYSKPK
jgi:hypothetical protein